MDIDFRVNLSSTNNAPVTGATVRLTNHAINHDGSQTVHTAISGVDGVTIPNVWAGTYRLHITFEGHRDYIVNSLVITYEGQSSYTTELIEIIRAPFALEVDINSQGDAVLSWNRFVPFIDDMEDHKDFVIDAIGDYVTHNFNPRGTFTFPVVNYPGQFAPHAFRVFNPHTTSPPMTRPGLFLEEAIPYAHSGDRLLINFAAGYNSFDMTKNSWLVLPKIRMVDGATFSFFARAYWYTYPEHIRVLVSTTGNRPEDFTTVISGDYHVHGQNFINVPHTWTEYRFDMSAYAKQEVYLAINLVSPEGSMAFLLDDISVDVDRPENSKSPVSFTVYLDEVIKATGITETEHIFRDLEDGTYTAGVQSVYASGVSIIQTITFVVDQTSVKITESEVLRVYPNPVADVLNIQTEQAIRQIVVLDQNGKIVKTQHGNHRTLNVQSLTAGHYIVKIHTATAIIPVRIVKK
jgi:hypothetical protein